jgi:hypothetical protein
MRSGIERTRVIHVLACGKHVAVDSGHRAAVLLQRALNVVGTPFLQVCCPLVAFGWKRIAGQELPVSEVFNNSVKLPRRIKGVRTV